MSPRFSQIKRILLKTPLARTLKEIEAQLHSIYMCQSSASVITGNKTVYCISPYKTGTTFLATSYKKDIAKHEPMQYFTLKNIDGDFDVFFLKRMNTLNLKLECSGFLSAYVDELNRNQLTRTLNYICVTRPPSKWIMSVVNYWASLDDLNYDYINELFWKQKVGVDLKNFMQKKENEKQLILSRLTDFYFSFTKKASMLPNIMFIDISQLTSYLGVLDEILGEKHVNAANRRENSVRVFNYANEEDDNRYKSFIADFRGVRTYGTRKDI